MASEVHGDSLSLSLSSMKQPEQWRRSEMCKQSSRCRSHLIIITTDDCWWRGRRRQLSSWQHPPGKFPTLLLQPSYSLNNDLKNIWINWLSIWGSHLIWARSGWGAHIRGMRRRRRRWQLLHCLLWRPALQQPSFGLMNRWSWHHWRCFRISLLFWAVLMIFLN